jgi:hypothetical protein
VVTCKLMCMWLQQTSTCLDKLQGQLLHAMGSHPLPLLFDQLSQLHLQDDACDRNPECSLYCPCPPPSPMSLPLAPYWGSHCWFSGACIHCMM